MKSDSLNHSLARFESNIRIQIQMSRETMIYHLHIAEVAADADADAIKLNPPFNQTTSSIHQRPTIHLPIPIRNLRIVIQSLDIQQQHLSQSILYTPRSRYIKFHFADFATLSLWLLWKTKYIMLFFLSYLFIFERRMWDGR